MKTRYGFLLLFCLVVRNTSAMISARKCAEYSLTPHSRSCHHKVSPILGYRPAEEREFPHTALLGIAKNTTHHHQQMEWFCTGVLISHEYVLALAECGFVFPMTDATYVRLGDFNYGSENEHFQPIDVKVAKVILHPKYMKKSLYDNIALIQLEHSVEFSMHIRPACLPETSEINSEIVSMTGWPFKLYSVPRSLRNKQDTTLRKYNMDPIDAVECKRILSSRSINGMSQGISDTQICARIQIEDEQRNFKILRPLEVVDGAPLQSLHNDERCMYTIWGLSHFKPTFGLTRVPLVFTRIYPYLSWIEQIVWPN